MFICTNFQFLWGYHLVAGDRTRLDDQVNEFIRRELTTRLYNRLSFTRCETGKTRMVEAKAAIEDGCRPNPQHSDPGGVGKPKFLPRVPILCAGSSGTDGAARLTTDAIA